MASIENSDYFFPFFPLPPPHQYPPSPPKVFPPYNSPSPPKVTPPHNPPPPKAAPPHSNPSPPKVVPSDGPIKPPRPPLPPPATPPSHSFNPPPPAAKPPHHSNPPPSPIMTPPPHPLSPPSPHVVPPPPPAPGHHSTIIVVVFVSLGGLFFLAFLSVALCFFIKKRKKRVVQKTEIVNFDEHTKVQEAIIPGPHGEQLRILSIEEDVHIDEVINKTEKVKKGSHIESAQDPPQAIKNEAASCESSHHHLEHKS